MVLQNAKEKVGHFLGFDQYFPYEEVPDYPNTDPYYETEPSVQEFIQNHSPSLRDVGSYIYRLFPFLDWILKYNWTWFLGDFIAGLFASSFFFRSPC